MPAVKSNSKCENKMQHDSWKQRRPVKQLWFAVDNGITLS